MRVRHRPDVRLIRLPGQPQREVFTATRASIAALPAIAACRAALADVVPRLLDLD